MHDRSSIMFSIKKLNDKTRARILHMFVEGHSLRATARMADVSRNTVDKLLRDVGSACLDYQDKALRDLPCKRVQCDEIWSFVYAKQKYVEDAVAAPNSAGDIWTWTAICADTKLAPCWHVGGRDAGAAKLFMDDLVGRLRHDVQLTTDGRRPYLEAAENAFHGDANYAQIVKLYGDSPKSEQKRYSPAVCTGAKKTRVNGKPDPKHISTSYVERQNLTMRISMQRFTRITNAFSKKVENHMHAISLHYMHYNFGRIHQTLKVTPAMEAGVTDHVWTLEEIAALATIEAPKKRGTYKKRKFSD